MKLFDIAHSRAGDKGNTLMLSLIPYKDSDYDTLLRVATEGHVREHMKHLFNGKLVRYELPNISSLLFVFENALMGGVTTSLGLDTHGKSLSSFLLEMEIGPDQ